MCVCVYWSLTCDFTLLYTGHITHCIAIANQQYTKQHNILLCITLTLIWCVCFVFFIYFIHSTSKVISYLISISLTHLLSLFFSFNSLFHKCALYITLGSFPLALCDPFSIFAPKKKTHFSTRHQNWPRTDGSKIKNPVNETNHVDGNHLG